MAGYADPIATPNSGNTWLEGILWGTQWDSGAAAGDPTAVSVYIGGLNGSETIALDGVSVTASAPYLQEIQAMIGAMEAMESVCGIEFAFTSGQSDADIIWASVDDVDADGALGWANPPGTAFSTPNNDEQSIIAINWEAYDPASPDANLLIPGGYDYVTYIHELGHAIGLAHPHDDGGGSTIFPGVSGAFDDYGDFSMNQGVFTMMSYNDGWPDGPLGLPPGATFGYAKGPMALDIAALQFMYGANMDYHAGADTYALPTANVAGTGYVCLWDAGGIDKIVGGDLGNVIDLRAATLKLEVGGGGWVSYANGIHGGFTIANGVVIENAVGGAGADTIRGNNAANTLSGLEGKDTLSGAKGADVLRGGDNDDRLDGNDGGDVLRGNDGSDSLNGGGGSDTLVGGNGLDRMAGGAAGDSFLFLALSDSVAGDRRDVIDGYQRGVDEIDVSAIDANELLAGPQAFKLDTGGDFAAGEIRQKLLSSGLLLQFNVDGDSAPDMTIKLNGVANFLTNADFVF